MAKNFEQEYKIWRKMYAPFVKYDVLLEPSSIKLQYSISQTDIPETKTDMHNLLNQEITINLSH